MKAIYERLQTAVTFGVLAILLWASHACGESLELSLRSRDAESGEITTAPTTIDTDRLGVVVVDIWNWHWCKTAAARIDSFVPRINGCLELLRAHGATIFVCPTDVVDAYVGLPQREQALAIDLLPMPDAIEFACPAPPNGPGCACLQRCRGNFGWNHLNPKLTLGEHDLMPNSRAALYTLAKERGITHLLYIGVHTQVCLLGKDIGLRNMKSLGFECILARDLTDSHPDYDLERGITPDLLTEQTVAHFERYLCPTVNLKNEFERQGYWKIDAPLDPVRAAPWGTKNRAHIFDDSTTVTLSTPLQLNAELYYTTDGTAPTTKSHRYREPIQLTDTANIRAAGFVGEQPVSSESSFFYYRRPAQPPLPDRHLSELTPISTLGPGHSPSDSDHRLSPGSRSPQRNRSNRGLALRVNGKEYDRGLGVHAPNRLAYRVDPRWARFVAEVGVDENIILTSSASDLGCMPSIIFRVILDGKIAAESPIMRFMHPTWRFDVSIPRGTRQIVLVALPTEDGNREDLGNWVNAGVCFQPQKTPNTSF